MRNLSLLLAQDYEAILAACRKKGEFEKWTDEVFPPVNDSICPVRQWDEKLYEGLQWIRASRVPYLTDDQGEVHVFDGEPTPLDIRQGNLNDSYLLSTLSVLAEEPSRIRALFHDTSYSREGVYCINMTKNGAKLKMCVDDHFVCKKSEPYYARASNHAIWVLLVEKAWAKLHGSFKRIEGG